MYFRKLLKTVKLNEHLFSIYIYPHVCSNVDEQFGQNLITCLTIIKTITSIDLAFYDVFTIYYITCVCHALCFVFESPLNKG